jgi:hypothetical protein
MSKSALLQDELPFSISPSACRFLLTRLKKYEIPQHELQLCIVTDNPLGTGMLITNINLICDDYSNWDFVCMTFHKYKVEKGITSLIAMLDIWHPEDDECTIKNRTAADVFKSWSKQFNNEVKNSLMTDIYPVYECAAVGKIARRLRKLIS